ncbi:hypothetical protein [Aurantiacibacter spongiae]|uniref:Uncharacterized protein n=1 Tax=Aurantiacibacter spongiae TaxID=2488860 RepID=A0A3N5CSD4_9SPHN|nr:hypothetical protein [Aurantiacibacter spongiae]RPF71497.1 hypothetical protein EG799_07625 [Aurantiacibacter spongiae]
MRRRSGPRPLAIHLFAALFLAQGLIAFGAAMTDLPAYAAWYVSHLPVPAPGRDAAIVLASARLTIAAIPVALVWLLAVRFARWFVAAVALARLASAPVAIADGTASGAWWASLALALFAAVCLFTPAAAAWFAGGRE